MYVMSSYHTTVSSKGQVVIPAELREPLGLQKGTRATWREERGRLVLIPVTERTLGEIRGFLRPGPGSPAMFDDLFAERERERRREKR